MQNRATGLAVAMGVVLVVAACDDTKTEIVNVTPTPTNIVYRATLTGAAERPTPTGSAGTGTFTGTLVPSTGILTYTVTYSGLGSNSTLAHIHGPATTEQAAGIIFNFASGTNPFVPGTPSGTFGGTILLTAANQITTTVNGDSLRKLMDAGLSYVNVHSQQFPGGEIRGQIAKQP